MPYESISDLPEEVRTLPEHGQKIFLAAFNSAYSGTCKNKGEDREGCAFSVAWSAVKRQYTRDGDTWVKKEGAGEDSASSFPLDFEIAAAAKDKPLTISGPLIEIGALNLNGWGLGEDEVNTVIAGLEGVPLRICSGKESLKNEHSCDYNNQPKSDIGKIISASEKDGWIHATAEVTDSIAARKISEGTWPKHWSIFLSYKAAQDNGFLSGVKPRSVTLVRKPAYPGAGFKAGGIMKDREEAPSEGPAAGGAREYTQDEIKSVLAYMKSNPKLIDDDVRNLLYAAMDKMGQKETMKRALMDMKEHPEMMDDNMLSMMRDMMKAQSAAYDKLNGGSRLTKEGEQGTEVKYTQADLDKAVAAAVEKERTANQEEIKGMMPRAEAEKLIAAAVEQAKTQTIEQLNKTSLIKEVAELQVSAGIIKPEDADKAKQALESRTAAALEQDKALLLRVKETLAAAGKEAINKFKEAQLPAKDNTPAAAGLEAAMKKINNKFKGAV